MSEQVMKLVEQSSLKSEVAILRDRRHGRRALPNSGRGKGTHSDFQRRGHRPQRLPARGKCLPSAASCRAKAWSGSSRCIRPRIAKVEVRRAGVVRRAKLYYLRDRVGKAVRLKQRPHQHGQAGRAARRARRQGTGRKVAVAGAMLAKRAQREASTPTQAWAWHPTQQARPAKRGHGTQALNSSDQAPRLGDLCSGQTPACPPVRRGSLGLLR